MWIDTHLLEEQYILRLSSEEQHQGHHELCPVHVGHPEDSSAMCPVETTVWELQISQRFTRVWSGDILMFNQ